MGVRKLADLLKPHDNRSFSDLLADLRKVLGGAPSPVATTNLVEEYAEKLQAASQKSAPIDGLLSELEKNKKLKNAELFHLAEQFLGSKAKFKSRKDAVRAIRQRHIERIQDDRNVAAIEKLSSRRR